MRKVSVILHQLLNQFSNVYISMTTKDQLRLARHNMLADLDAHKQAIKDLRANIKALDNTLAYLIKEEQEVFKHAPTD